MDMRSCTTSGVPDIRDEFATGYTLAFFHIYRMKVGVFCRDAGAMRYSNRQPVAAMSANKRDFAFRRSVNGGSDRGGDVQTFVEFPFAGERRGPIAEP